MLDPRFIPKVEYERYGSAVYCPFDPELTIDGERLRFIVNFAADPGSLHFDHFKELGRWISVDLSEEKVKTEIRRRLTEDLETVERCGVNGLCKLYLYEHFVVRRMSWVFLVHDLSLSFARDLDKVVIRHLKRWAGLYRSSDVGSLFRLRKHLGLQLTSVEYHFEHLQLVKCCLLESSKDETVQAIYKRRTERVRDFTSRWSAPNELKKLEPVVEHSFCYAGQTGHAGLGANRSDPYIAKPSVRQLRERTTVALRTKHEENHVRHASCLLRQGVWTHWDNVLPFDLSWENLIYGPGPRVISFLLNAQINSVRTPDMLKLWGFIDSAACHLCAAPLCSLHHILVNCNFALNQGRYTWRHDSVLVNLKRTLEEALSFFNNRRPAVFAELARKDFHRSFVRPGQTRKLPSATPRRGLLDFANDWKMQVDFASKPTVFPPLIYATAERPDIVLWSPLSRTVILLELTCPGGRHCCCPGKKRSALR